MIVFISKVFLPSNYFLTNGIRATFMLNHRNEFFNLLYDGFENMI